MTKPKVTDKEAAERSKMVSYEVVHGAKIAVFDLGEIGIQITITNPNQEEDFISIQIPPEDVGRLTSWLRVYLAKVKGQRNGKSKKENGHGDSD